MFQSWHLKLYVSWTYSKYACTICPGHSTQINISKLAIYLGIQKSDLLWWSSLEFCILGIGTLQSAQQIGVDWLVD